MCRLKLKVKQKFSNDIIGKNIRAGENKRIKPDMWLTMCLKFSSN